MILIAAVDDKGGMTFNHRRQSQDKTMREKMIAMSGGQAIYMNAYSAKLFPDNAVCVSEDFLDVAGDGMLCFVENVPAAPYEEKIERIVLFRWNRIYPAGTYFDIDLEAWECISSEEFAGSSHEKITMEIYEKKER